MDGLIEPARQILRGEVFSREEAKKMHHLEYYCRNGVYNERQVLYKGVNGKGLVLGDYRTTDARFVWNTHKFLIKSILQKSLFQNQSF